MFKRFGARALAALGLATLLVGSVVAPASAAPDEHIVHIVQHGETLYSIARSYGVSMWSIAQANSITNPNLIYAGQRLVVPTGTGGGGYIGGGHSGAVHVVQRGETLTQIALRYGVSVYAIAQVNGITNPNLIYAGQRLAVPTGTGGGGGHIGGGHSGAVHVVQRGETLYSIARSYGVSMWSVARTNGITDPNHIYAGQRLVIP
jgi:LysM repeat protein